MVMISTKYKAIKKIKVPKWAEWETHTKTTVKDAVQTLIEELPKGYKFYAKLIHEKLITVKGFEMTRIRRTREALQQMIELEIISHESTNRDNFISIDGNKVKLYEVM